MSELLKAHAVHKVFRKNGTEVHVLKGIDFALGEGQSAVVVGQSGSGKSTFLQILGSIMQPSSGEVFFQGENILKFSEKGLNVYRSQHLGFVFQFHHLLPDFTALENVMMPLLIRKVSPNQAAQEAKACLERVGLSERLHHPPHSLSGGEQQRVAIARALVGSPRLILADEPTGNLDTENAHSVASLLFGLAKERKMGMVMATHNMEIINQADRVLRLKGGQLEKTP